MDTHCIFSVGASHSRRGPAVVMAKVWRKLSSKHLARRAISLGMNEISNLAQRHAERTWRLRVENDRCEALIGAGSAGAGTGAGWQSCCTDTEPAIALPKTDRCTQACQNGAWQRKIWKQDARRVNLCAEERARDSLEPLAAEAREKAESPSAEKNRFPREKLHDVVGGGSVGSRGIERSGHLLPSLALGQVAEEEEARRCHRHGRRTGT